MRILQIFLLISVGFLAGCSMAPKMAPKVAPKTAAAPPSSSQVSQRWDQHQKQVSAATHWQAEGRLAAAHGQKGGNASFVWQQRGDSYKIKLFGPFGSGAVLITGNPQQVTLKEGNGNITNASSPETLLQKVAGWQVPLIGLRYWLRGIPTPNNASTPQLTLGGQLDQLQQNGWKIRYENYTTHDTLPLPSKLNLQNGDIKVKMVVTSWRNLRS